MSAPDEGAGAGPSQDETPWYEGVSGWLPLSRAFIDRELVQPDPDYGSLADRLAPYSPAERHAGWIGIAQSAPSRMARTRAYVEALHNDPDPTSVAWSWLDGDFDLMERVEHVLRPDDEHTPATVQALRDRIGSIVDVGGAEMAVTPAAEVAAAAETDRDPDGAQPPAVESAAMPEVGPAAQAMSGADAAETAADAEEAAAEPAGAEAEAAAEPMSGAEAEAAAEPMSGAEAEAAAEPMSGAETEAAAESATEPASGAEAEAAAEPGGATEPVAGVQGETSPLSTPPATQAADEAWARLTEEPVAVETTQPAAVQSPWTGAIVAAQPAGGRPATAAAFQAAQAAALTFWSPTHYVPAGGMAAWDYPDPARPPRVVLNAGLGLVIDGVAGDWAFVRAVNGWRGWVDGRRLTAKP